MSCAKEATPFRRLRCTSAPIELDPNFAMAYARMGNQYLTVGQADLARQNFQKAFELRERASEREKFYITDKYYDGTGQWEQAIQALELYAQTYPSDWAPRVNLSVSSSDTRRL